MTDQPASATENTPVDDGARLGVGIAGLNVTLEFDKPVQKFGLTPDQAHRLARLLMKQGKRCAKQILQRKRELARKVITR